LPRGGYVDKVLRISLAVLVLALAVAAVVLEAWLLYVSVYVHGD
jgi:hypothetical protein